jgi:hypothetical protein
LLIHSNRFAFINYLSKALIRPEGRDLASENVRVYGERAFRQVRLAGTEGQNGYHPGRSCQNC